MNHSFVVRGYKFLSSTLKKKVSGIWVTSGWNRWGMRKDTLSLYWLYDKDDEFQADEKENRQLLEILQGMVISMLNALTDKIHQTSLGRILIESRLYTHTSEAVIAFDTFCRYFFPATFSIINIVYWLLYSVIL